MSTILVVDLGTILDESRQGKEAAQQLSAEFQQAKAQYDALAQKAETLEGLPKAEAQAQMARIEADALNAIEGKRAKMRSDLLEKAQPVIDRIAKKKGADLVLERDLTLFRGANVTDITDQVLRSLDKKAAT
jgi:Skp family chaperone for outer membrane proteins